jgi:hypothetical protein
MSEIRDPIYSLRETPVDARRLAQVRGRVLERLGVRRPGPGRWVLAGATAVCGLIAAAVWLTRPEAVELPAVAWTAPPPPGWALTPAARSRAEHGLPPVARPRVVRRPAVRREIEVVTVQTASAADRPDTALLAIPTSNPDVVLYWLVDGGGD